MKNTFSFLVLLGWAHLSLGQGSLTPPGAPAPTMKSLSQVEPRIAITNTGFVSISQPGSYYLTTNISVNSGDGVVITTNRVTLDLNGFTISSTSPAGTGVGININGGRSDITILNGHVTGGVTNNAGVFNGPGFADGISYSGGVAANIHVSAVTVSGCRVNGIVLGNNHSSSVKSCVVYSVGGTGIQAASVSDSSAYQCNSGISADTVQNSYGQGIASFGIQAVTAENCYGQSTSGSGLAASLAQNCYGTSSGAGIGLNASVAQNCFGASGSSYGIYCDIANTSRATSAIGTPLYAGYSAFLCVGSTSGAGPGINTYIANSCYGSPSVSATFKYNMP
ncbi:MAG TPA: hypothetical protein VMZ27_08275 [Candidatus Saccharimonadales bacterium]|nr:hypothetical protein [Candidatus Saccharimonadales bacterium]